MIGSLFLGLISDFPLVDWGMLQMATVQLASAFILSIIVIYFLVKFLPKSKVWNNLVLNKNIDEQSGYTAEEDLKELIGKSGKALTDLRPSGSALLRRKNDVVLMEIPNKGTNVLS